MKTLFTYLLLFVVSISSFAQKTATTSPLNGTLSPGMSSNAQSFTLLKLYPNPVKDLVFLDLQLVRSGSVNISLFNILGTEVKKWDSFALSAGDQKLKLDLSEFKSGIYFLKISGTGQTLSQVVKKN